MALSLRLAHSAVFMLSMNQNPWTEHGIAWLIFILVFLGVARQRITSN